MFCDIWMLCMRGTGYIIYGELSWWKVGLIHCTQNKCRTAMAQLYIDFKGSIACTADPSLQCPMLNGCNGAYWLRSFSQSKGCYPWNELLSVRAGRLLGHDVILSKPTLQQSQRLILLQPSTWCLHSPNSQQFPGHLLLSLPELLSVQKNQSPKLTDFLPWSSMKHAHSRYACKLQLRRLTSHWFVVTQLTHRWRGRWSEEMMKCLYMWYDWLHGIAHR